MSPKDQKTGYDPLNETDVPPAEGDFSLEEILAEYGGGRKKIFKEVEEIVFQADQKQERPEVQEIREPLFHRPPEPSVSLNAPPIPSPPAPETAEREVQPKEEPPEEAPPKGTAAPETMECLDLSARFQQDLPEPPRPISLEEVVSDTVDSVMEEKQEPLLENKKRRGLFSRKPMEDTEELYESPEPEETLTEEDLIGSEPELSDAAEGARMLYQKNHRPLLAAFLVALIPCVLMGVQEYGVEIPLWSADLLLQTLVLLVCLLAVSLLTWPVFARAGKMLWRRRCSWETLMAVSALAAAGDCISCLLLPERSPVTPYAAVAGLGLVMAQWGAVRESRGLRDLFRTAAVDSDPPYLVTETERGACKQNGAVRGFYTAAVQDDAATLLQRTLLPVVLAGSLVFAFLSSTGQGRNSDFWLNWSAILCGSAAFGLPLCWGLPWSRLAAHLQKTGCAVAGWCGAEKISGKRSMILTDADLFPPGTIQLNGVKVFGEELPKAASYAASLAKDAGCGLHRLFDGLLRSECAHYEQVDDFSFYEEGGYSATIRGETVLLGTASFMRKMEVRLPSGINLRTGIFLAVDHQITAVFAVKYNASENVDFALRMMRKSHITPILASRDPNITPALLKRKFHKSVKVEYPDLTTRVALSEAEQDRGLPRALLLREGLLPYAETVVGSRRLCKAVRWSAALALLGSIAGTLLSFYLVFLGSYGLLTPVAMLLFLLLWTLPVLLLADWVGRY